MPEYRFIQYELLDEGTIARITLDRPGSRNAQNRGLLVELDDAFGAAEADDQVRVVILCGAGPMFSSGHDMGSKDHLALKLRTLGFTPRQVVLLMAAVAGVFSLEAYAATRSPFYVSWALLSVTTVIGLFVVFRLDKVRVP